MGRLGILSAPLVDSRMQVVGLVHGGAACRIDTHTAGLGAVVEDLSRSGPELARQGATRRR